MFTKIKLYGIRDNWYGIVEVGINGIKKGEMAHAKSLGNTIVNNAIIKEFGYKRFVLTISRESKLIAKKS